MDHQNPYPPPPPQFQYPKPQGNMGKDILKVLSIQLGIFLLYQGILYYLVCVAGMSQFTGFEMTIVVLHWIVSLVLMIVFLASRKTGIGLGFLISFIILLVIGFGSCAYIFSNGMMPMNDRESMQQLFRDDSINAAQTRLSDSIRAAQQTLNSDTLSDTLSH